MGPDELILEAVDLGDSLGSKQTPLVGVLDHILGFAAAGGTGARVIGLEWADFLKHDGRSHWLERLKFLEDHGGFGQRGDHHGRLAAGDHRQRGRVAAVPQVEQTEAGALDTVWIGPDIGAGWFVGTGREGEAGENKSEKQESAHENRFHKGVCAGVAR